MPTFISMFNIYSIQRHSYLDDTSISFRGNHEKNLNKQTRLISESAFRRTTWMNSKHQETERVKFPFHLHVWQIHGSYQEGRNMSLFVFSFHVFFSYFLIWFNQFFVSDKSYQRKHVYSNTDSILSTGMEIFGMSLLLWLWCISFTFPSNICSKLFFQTIYQ